MKTEFNKRPEREKKEDSEKFIRRVMRHDFDPAKFWGRIRREIAEQQGKN